MSIVFFIAGITGGGAERVLVTLANAFVDRGEKVMIFCRDKAEEAYQLDTRVIIRYLSDCLPPYSSNPWKRFDRKMKTSLAIRRVLKEFKADVAVSFTAFVNVLIIPHLLFSRIPLICCEHSTVTRQYAEKTMLRKRRRFYPFVNAVTVLTRYDYYLWRDKRNVVRMPNPFIPAKLTGTKQREKIVLAAGRIEQWHIKGFDNLIRCWAQLWKEYPEWKLIIAGAYTPKSMATLNELIAETNCQSIEFPGFCSNLNQMMEQSEIFCLSSRLEGMPMVLLEAMNAGCACVANDCVTGPSEMIRNGENGLLAKRDNNDDLTEKLRQMMNSEELRQRFRENIDVSLRQYELERIMTRWYILFKKLNIKTK